LTEIDKDGKLRNVRRKAKAPAEVGATHRGLRPKEDRAPMARNLSIRTESPEVLPDGAPHGCYEGWVYLGHIEYEDENGEPQEVIERVPCRRWHTAREIL
jgi:hypothetical protein